MNFDELQLSPSILKALSQCAYTEPTPVQAQAIPLVLAGKDVIASAQTGTGKTAAFVLPALQLMSQTPSAPRSGPRVLVLTPTRELADQITQATRTYGRYMTIKSVAIFGGMPYREQLNALARYPEMIIATPGRLLDHMERGRIDLDKIELFILDEADRMLDMGFIDDVERIAAAVPTKAQILLFAATMGKGTTNLAGKFMKEPERVEIAPGRLTHECIEQRLHVADGLEHKTRLLKHICSDATVSKAIIFSATKRDADTLAHALLNQGHSAAAIHGDMTQNARNRTILNLRNGKIRLLVATDVAARGLDVTGISHVINFDLPRFAEDYVHRIGRTGRAGESGIAISFASRADLPYLDRIERYIGLNLIMTTIPGLEPAYPLRTLRTSTDRGRPSGSYAGKSSGSYAGKSSGSYAGKSSGSYAGKTSGSYAAKTPGAADSGFSRGGSSRPQRDFVVEHRTGSGSQGRPDTRSAGPRPSGPRTRKVFP